MREAAPSRTQHLLAAASAALAVAVLVAGPGLLGDRGRLASVLLVQAALVASWILVTRPPGGVGAAGIGAAAAVAADLALSLPERPRLGGLLTVLGVSFLVVVLHQMLRRPRSELVASLAFAVLLVCAVSGLAALLLVDPAAGTTALLAVGAALVAGHTADLLLPRPPVAPDVPMGPLGRFVAVLAGAAVVVLRRGDGDVLAGALQGALLGAAATLTGLVAAYVVAEAVGRGAPSSSARAFPVLQASLPVAACAPIVLALQTTP